MSDNFVINGTSVGGGANIALDDIGGGVLVQRIKLKLGADGVDNGDVSASNPMPVTGAISGTVAVSSIGSTVGVSGTVTANQGTAAAGSGAWPTSTIEDSTNTIVKPGDSTNKAIRVNVVSGSTGNAAASNTGSAVPSQADYGGLNVSGTLRGATGVNPTGTVYAQQIDIASLNNVALGSTLPVSGSVTVSGTVSITQPTLFVGRATYSAAQTDAAIATPTSGKSINLTRLTVATDNDNTAKLTFRIGCGTTNTPTTTGVVMSHPGMSNNKEYTIGNGLNTLTIGTVNQPLRITATDPTGAWDVNYEYFET